MKNLIKKLSKMNNVKLIIGLVVASVLLISCQQKKENIKNFKGKIIYSKLSNLAGDRALEVNEKDGFKKVFVHKFIWDQYKVGDTIQ